jgi:hypothetical protein
MLKNVTEKCSKDKIKQSLYNPGETLEFPGV